MNFQPTQESDQGGSNSADFEAKVQFLMSELHSDTLLSVLNSTPDLSSSLKLFEWASLQKRFYHTAETYELMILKLGMAGKLEEMEGFCNDMVRGKCPGFDKSLLALIDSFISNHRFSEALRVLYVMNSSSCKLSIGVFNSLMGALVDGKREFKDVLFVYKELVKAGIVPNVDTLNYLLEALFESGRVDTALDQYRRMHKKGCSPNVRTFQILISGLASRDRVKDSVSVLEEMFQSGCEPDSGFYRQIITMFCELKNLNVGLKLFKMMRASDIALNSVIHGAMIRCFCEHLRMDDAVKLFEEMVDSGLLPDLQVSMDIVNGFCGLDKLDEARNFLKEKHIADPCLYNVVLGSYCDNGNLAMARDMLDKMFEQNMIDAKSWNIFIRFLCKKSLINKALEYLCRMITFSFTPDPATYAAVILGHCRAGQVVNALGLFSYIRLKYWVLDSISYAEFIDCLCQRGSIQEATSVFCYMSGKGCALESASFGLLIEKICAGRDINRAVKLLSLAYCSGTNPLCATYNIILGGLSKSGQEKILFEILFSKMVVSGCVFDAKTFCIVIQYMIALGRTENCMSLFNLMLSEDMKPDKDTLSCLLSHLAKYSQVHLILPHMGKIAFKSEILDSTLYSLLIRNLWREGYKNEARWLLDLTLEKGWIPDASTHALLMGSFEGEKTFCSKFANENACNEDSVSCILDEGLGK